MATESAYLKSLVLEMRLAFARGENAMALARERENAGANSVASTLIAYDLQAGSYVNFARDNADYIKRWCSQIGEFIKPYVDSGSTILEVGVGEATTLAGILEYFDNIVLDSFGFDVSWSRIKVGNNWVKERRVQSQLFVGDLFRIPLEDNSIDVVYTSHSLEPNGGREREAIAELLRVARKAVVMIEPIFELASEQAQARMSEHGYVRDLKGISESLGAEVAEYGLLGVCSNNLNPSGIVQLKKRSKIDEISGEKSSLWQCPITGVSIVERDEYFLAKDAGIAYPVLRGVPLLRAEHAVVASLIE
ncbi:MAG: class I SAM-dependent methyltransferase [Pseudohongiella sp.]|nr:class I SAM-dependent methyltransferase [Pseudohongiella sp.]